jgi:hypothetical protein
MSDDTKCYRVSSGSAAGGGGGMPSVPGLMPQLDERRPGVSRAVAEVLTAAPCSCGLPLPPLSKLADDLAKVVAEIDLVHRVPELGLGAARWQARRVELVLRGKCAECAALERDDEERRELMAPRRRHA